MTLRQEAYGLIDTLPDDCIRIIIRLMYKMESRKPVSLDLPDERKLNAFLELEQMRKSMVLPEDFYPEKELQEALDEKYGCVD